MVIRYRGTSPKLGSCQGECPYPCNSVLGGVGSGDDDGFFLNLRLSIVFCSFRSSTSCSRLNTLLHNSYLFSCKRRKRINSIFGFFALSGRLDFLNSTCMSQGWGNGASSSSELLSLRESWIRGCTDSRTITFGRTLGLWRYKIEDFVPCPDGTFLGVEGKQYRYVDLLPL